MYFIGLCCTRAPNSVRALLETIHHTFCSSEPCRTACLDGAASLVFLTPHLVFLLRCEALLCVLFWVFFVVWCWGPSCNGSKMMFLCNHIKKGGKKIETECIYPSSFYGLKSIDTGRWCPYGSGENHGNAVHKALDACCRDLLPLSPKNVTEVGHRCWAMRPGFLSEQSIHPKKCWRGLRSVLHASWCVPNADFFQGLWGFKLNVHYHQSLQEKKSYEI